MKKRALELAKKLEWYSNYPEFVEAGEMIRRLVEELDKWENPLYRALPVIREKINSKPIAWLHEPSGMIFDSIVEAVKKDELTPLYTAPQTKPLSDEELESVIEKMVDAYNTHQSPVDKGYSQQEYGMYLALIAGGFIEPRKAWD